MQIHPTHLDGVVIVEPKVYTDLRGYFFESYQKDRNLWNGIPCDFVQASLSFSIKGTLQGLHYQCPRAQTKLVSVIVGKVFYVALYIRRGSATLGRWAGVILSGYNHRRLLTPEDFAHGF